MATKVELLNVGAITTKTIVVQSDPIFWNKDMEETIGNFVDGYLDDCVHNDKVPESITVTIDTDNWKRLKESYGQS